MNSSFGPLISSPVTRRSIYRRYISSINQLQRELNLAGRLRCSENCGPGRIEIQIQAVCAEIRMVQHVEELRPKLQPPRLFEVEIFKKRSVHGHLRRAV